MSGIDLGPTFGSATLASFLGAGLFGFTFLQTYTYFVHKSPHDHVVMKLGILLLWMLDCMQAVFLVWTVYWYLVQNYFNPLALAATHWPLPLSWIMSGLGCLISEAYFIPHIWRLSSRNYILTGLIALTALGQFASTLTMFIRALLQLDIINPELTVQIGPTLISQQVFASISNNLISGSLIYFNHKKTKNFFRNNGWFEGILIIFLDYATLAGILQVVYLAIHLAYPESFLSLPYQVATGKLLVNALLAQLNARDMGRISQPNKPALGLQLDSIPRRIVSMDVQNISRSCKAALENDSQSTPSKGDVDLERQAAPK